MKDFLPAPYCNYGLMPAEENRYVRAFSFFQCYSSDEYLQALRVEGDSIPYDPQPLARYNVSPGTRVLLLSERDEGYALDPVLWGYRPEWWEKAPLINARSETAATGKMFSKL